MLEFSVQLAELFYQKIVTAVSCLDEGDSIAILKILYQSITNYWPYITYATSKELELYRQTNPGTDYFFWLTDTKNELSIETDSKLDEQFAILENLTESNYRPHYGDKMWSMVAKKLNTTFSQFPIFDHSFFALASGDLDHDLSKNLRNSGATKEQMKAWRKKGYV